MATAGRCRSPGSTGTPNLQKKILDARTRAGHDAGAAGLHRPRARRASRNQFPGAKLQKITWVEWNTFVLDPLDPLFPASPRRSWRSRRSCSARDHLYAADTFIEMTPPSGDTNYLAGIGRAIYDGMAATDPQAVWVLQGWTFFFARNFWTQPRIEAVLAPVPDDADARARPLLREHAGLEPDPGVLRQALGLVQHPELRRPRLARRRARPHQSRLLRGAHAIRRPDA